MFSDEALRKIALSNYNLAKQLLSYRVKPMIGADTYPVRERLFNAANDSFYFQLFNHLPELHCLEQMLLKPPLACPFFSRQNNYYRKTLLCV